jgi:hypothetical protein
VADSDNDLETRVGILEREVARLREQAALTSSDAAAARVLAAGADHDVSEVRSELRAHTQALNALRETQLEQGEAISSLKQDVVNLKQDVVNLDQKMSAGFATLNTGMTKITALLESSGSQQE